MATRIRLQRHGAKGAPYYKIVVADSRSKRDGRYIDQVGTYNPTTIPATIDLNLDKAVKWLQSGAEPTNTVNAILGYKGALYKKHLLRGVTLGVVKAEEVEAKFEAWVQAKEGKVLDHKQKAHEAKLAKLKASVDAPAKVKKVEEVPAEEAPAEEVAKETAPEAAAETTPEAAAEPAAEATETPAE